MSTAERRAGKGNLRTRPAESFGTDSEHQGRGVGAAAGDWNRNRTGISHGGHGDTAIAAEPVTMAVARQTPEPLGRVTGRGAEGDITSVSAGVSGGQDVV